MILYSRSLASGVKPNLEVRYRLINRDFCTSLMLRSCLPSLDAFTTLFYLVFPFRSLMGQMCGEGSQDASWLCIMQRHLIRTYQVK